MEISCPSNLNNSKRLKYFFSKLKKIVQRPRRNKQRLIPLTKEIQKAMMDFNVSHSSTSISERPTYNTMSITSLVRGEVQSILQELSLSEQFIRKEDIDDLIDKCLKEKVTSLQECDDKAQHIIFGDKNEEYEITVEELTDDKDRNKLLVQNIKIMEDRISTLETRLNYMLHNIPKLKHMQAKRFKINVSSIKEKLNALYKLEEAPIKEDITQDQIALPKDVEAEKPKRRNLYDDIFYTTREYTLNLLNYKKSLETIELNQKPRWNPYVRPANIILPPLEEKFKKRSMFLDTN